MVITHVMMCCSGICVPNFFVHRDWAGAKCHTIFIFVIVIWLVEDCWLSKLMWELTLQSRIYCPNFSLYMSFRTEHCWRKLGPTEAGEYKNNAVISLFLFLFLFLFGKSWRHLVPHIWWQWSAGRAWETENEVLKSEILYPPCPSGRRIRPTVLNDRETGQPTQIWQ